MADFKSPKKPAQVVPKKAESPGESFPKMADFRSHKKPAQVVLKKSRIPRGVVPKMAASIGPQKAGSRNLKKLSLEIPKRLRPMRSQKGRL